MKTETKLIAEFMGLKQSDELYKGHFTYLGDDIINAGLPFSNGIMGNCMDVLPFDTSWSWIMPVVEKIEGLKHGIYQVDIVQEGCRVMESCKHFKNPIDKTISKVPNGTTKLQSVYMAVVEFIKWYNEQQQNDLNQNQVLGQSTII